MVNEVRLIGCVGKKPETHFVKKEAKKVVTFLLATSEKNAAGIKKTEWHNISCWNSLAIKAEEKLKGGELVYITGRIGSYTSRSISGNTKKTIITANNLKILRQKPDEKEL